MLNLKAIWAKVKDEPHTGDVWPASVPRRLPASSRSDYRSTPPVQRTLVVDTREAPRFLPNEMLTNLVTTSGNKLPARIINLSALGVAVEADFSQVSPHMIVAVGKRRVTPGRLMVRGSVFVFETPLRQRICDVDLVL